MIKNVLLEIAFDGSGFSGFQYQKDQRTIEEELKKAINKVTGEENRIISCGRTDAGVHAKSHFVNFLTATNINPKAFCFHIQPHLPDDILALSSKEVDLGFHARFSCKTKTYRYLIKQTKPVHPIYRNYLANIDYKLDYDKLGQGLKILEGEHDFRLFMKEDDKVEVNTLRTIDECFFIKERDELSLYFRANSFLHNQVRIMSGALIELARGRISIEDFEKFFDKESKTRANPALSPKGLYLWEVEY